jgi:hypothetical protein
MRRMKTSMTSITAINPMSSRLDTGKTNGLARQ